MDPVSQAVLGAVAAQGGARNNELRSATVVGLLGGMAADLDVLIRSPTDPLLFLEFHRQFTHALAFIPVGGLLVALALHALFARRHLAFRRTWLFATIGYATHGLLDACTTYGTQLLWPFSNTRTAWNVVSIVDPLFTLPILGLMALAARRLSRPAAWIAMGWALLYLGAGALQRDRAEAIGHAVAKTRGHAPIRLEAKPSFGNLLLWKIVYESGGRFHVDSVYAGIETRFYPGESVPVLNESHHLPWLDPSSQQAVDVQRFRWFSNTYVALHPEDPTQVIDVRYSIVPNEIRPLWAIRLNPHAHDAAHAEFLVSRETDRRRRSRFWRMLTGN